MTERSRRADLTLSIAAVERDTGLSKDTLRVWERRYGFPAPARDGAGERAYPLAQVDKLRIVKRLLDAGHRPGRIVPLPLDALQALNDSAAESPRHAAEVVVGSAELRGQLDLLRRHDMPGLRNELLRLLARYGVARFVTGVVGPLNAAVGDAWIRGQLEIFEEHMYTETVHIVLRRAIAGLPDGAHDGMQDKRPRVLLSTFPGEPHGLGLLMAEAVLALDGCDCTSLGVQTPLWDIVLAALAQDTDIVALSFTGCMNPNQIVDGLSELRAKLPPAVQVWAGGSAPVLHRRPVAGVQAFGTLDDMPAALHRWRAGAAAQRVAP